MQLLNKTFINSISVAIKATKTLRDGAYTEISEHRRSQANAEIRSKSRGDFANTLKGYQWYCLSLIAALQVIGIQIKFTCSGRHRYENG
ncbi:hypothetical protein Desgi_2576 [Desulfoscipio gibsoniae DSM 7213]|uniref:Uncharacterized protein n=1 Tax=Desulfoscipio gibsoniae DSM 7213 TaxID=767817 RepID=R4KK49_9FIRM|nr:hypothetical protein Desgi_2576 [Desulfoscipio gibsoniae DSM 7213]